MPQSALSQVFCMGESPTEGDENVRGIVGIYSGRGDEAARSVWHWSS
jgi:hypothetical protein